MEKTEFKSIDEYISKFPKGVQEQLQTFRQIVKKTATGAVEAISYKMPTFKLNGRNLVHFAAFKDHIGFYPVPSGIKAFKKELSSYKQGKGSVQFPLNKPLPTGLIGKIVKFRVKEEVGNGEK